MDENKKMEVVFAPGCFDDFQGTPEELAELIAKIHKMADSGEIFENARPLSEEEAAEFLAKQTQTRQ
jgi:hypothetical protein